MAEPPARYDLIVRRRLFNLAAVVSLVLCVATVALWVRAYWADSYYSTYYSYKRSHGPVIDREWIALSTRSSLGLYVNLNVNLDRRLPRTAVLRLPGIFYAHQWTAWSTYHGNLDVKHWVVVVATGIAPFLWVLSRVRIARRRKLTGLCPTCGYDLRATPDRCPECGTAVT